MNKTYELTTNSKYYSTLCIFSLIRANCKANSVCVVNVLLCHVTQSCLLTFLNMISCSFFLHLALPLSSTTIYPISLISVINQTNKSLFWKKNLFATLINSRKFAKMSSCPNEMKNEWWCHRLASCFLVVVFQ